MGAPTSALFSEVYLQYLEDSTISLLLSKNNVINYFRYVDDILIVYKPSTTNIHKLFQEFYDIHSSLQLTIETEQNNSINFLDLSILKLPDRLSYSIYRKPTTTDSIIPHDSCHPTHHKLSAIHHMIQRRDTYQLNPLALQIANTTIHHTLQNNGYSTTLLKPPSTTRPTSTKQSTNHKTDKKWARYTYVGPETRCITNLFRNSTLNIAFSTHNTLQKLLSNHPPTTTNQFNKSGIYQLTCPDCSKVYVGQTGRSFSTRYKEHFRDYTNLDPKSKFTEHLIQSQHSFGPINNVMKPLHFTSKGRHMNTIERYHIYKETYKNNQLNDRHTVQPNAIFETLLRIHPRPTPLQPHSHPSPIKTDRHQMIH